MKMRFLIFTVIASVWMGCADSGKLPINEENLSGKWYFQKIKIDSQPFENYSHDCTKSKDYMEFLADRNLKYYKHGSDCLVNSIVNYSWVLEGTKLTTLEQDPLAVGSNVYKVMSLTKNELILSLDFPISATEKELHKYYYTRK